MILILNFGSKYTPLFGQHLHEIGAKYEVVPFDISLDDISARQPNGLILSGSEDHAYDSDSRKPANGIFDLNIPILGVCYGMQLMAQHFGGKIGIMDSPEEGIVVADIEALHPLFQNLPNALEAHMDHEDIVLQLPESFLAAGSTSLSPIASMYHTDKPLYGVQFHLESLLPKNDYGRKMLQNFVNICDTDQWRLGRDSNPR